MTKWFKRLFRNQEGMTLIELIVVVAIIGLLAWLITPRVLQALDTAENNSANSVATEAQAALERYAVEHDGAYPAGAAGDDWADFKVHVGDTLKLSDGDDRVVDVTATTYASPGDDTFDLNIDFNNGCVIDIDETGVTNNTCS